MAISILIEVRHAQYRTVTLQTGKRAFSRLGDPSTGEFEDAEAIRCFGAVPRMDELLSPG